MADAHQREITDAERQFHGVTQFDDFVAKHIGFHKYFVKGQFSLL